MCTIKLRTEENWIKFSNFYCTETKLLQNKSKNNYDLGTAEPKLLKFLIDPVPYYNGMIHFVNLSKWVITQFPLQL